MEVTDAAAAWRNLLKRADTVAGLVRRRATSIASELLHLEHAIGQVRQEEPPSELLPAPDRALHLETLQARMAALVEESGLSKSEIARRMGWKRPRLVHKLKAAPTRAFYAADVLLLAKALGYVLVLEPVGESAAADEAERVIGQMANDEAGFPPTAATEGATR